MEAERPLTANPKKISYVVPLAWACAWYRAHVPGMELHRRGHDVIMHEDVQSLSSYLADNDPDVQVIQAMVSPQILDIVKRLASRDTLVVFDMDDDPLSVQAANPGAVFWGRHEVQQLLAEVARTVDVITTTTPELAEVFSRFNKNVFVLPNQLPSEHWPSERMPLRDSETLVVGWAGSESHVQDMGAIQDVLFQILERHTDVEVHLAGTRPEWFHRTHPRLRLVESVKIEQYPQLLAGFDIAIAPLLDNKFNRAKSDLKVVEYGMLGLPVVASKSPSYCRFIRHGENGLLAGSDKDWLKALSALIESRDLRDKLGGNIRRAAQNRVIERHIGKWEKVYGITG